MFWEMPRHALKNGATPPEITVYNDGVNTGPTGIAIDPTGNVHISEYYSGTWVKYAPSSGKAPLCVVSEGVGGPEGIALDGNGNVYVSNSRLNNITVYSQATCAYIRTIT